MSKTTELANLGSILNLAVNSASSTANTFNVDVISSKKITVTDGRPGNAEFDAGNTAYPAIELLSGLSTVFNRYTPAIKFGSTDSSFVTQNPKFGAAIVAEAAQNYTTDATGGMALSFWTSPTAPGSQTSLRERLTIEASGQITVNNNLALAMLNSSFNYAVTGTSRAGARILKFTDNKLYIDNYDYGDILLRTGLNSVNTALTIHASNSDVRMANNVIVQDLYMDSGYGSSGKVYGCRAWVNFNGIGTVSIFESGGISSITDEGVGLYRLNFSSPFPDIRYAIAGSADGVSSVSYPSFVSYSVPITKTTTSVIIAPRLVNGGAFQNPYDAADISCVIFR